MVGAFFSFIGTNQINTTMKLQNAEPGQLSISMYIINRGHKVIPIKIFMTPSKFLRNYKYWLYSFDGCNWNIS